MFNELLKRDALNTRDAIFTKIELPENDIVVPFICRKCGSCCMTYIPRIPTEDLITIAKDLKFSSEGLISLYSNIYLKRLCGKTEPCLFLDNRRLCMIYGHPLRPDVCRLYPFSFGGTDADCDAYLEHKRVVEILLADEKSFEIYDASFCPNRNVRLISDSKWPQIHSKLKRLNVTGDMIRAFMILNGASKF